jgi:hypothetical protein
MGFNIPPKYLISAAEIIDAAQYFDYNVDWDEWVVLWDKACKSMHIENEAWLCEHTRRKFFEKKDFLGVYGHSDLRVMKILAAMTLIRAKEKDPQVFTRLRTG